MRGIEGAQPDTGSGMATAGTKRKLRVVHGAPATAPEAAQSAVRTLDLECDGLQALRAAVDAPMREPFRIAVETLAAAKGRVKIGRASCRERV